MITAVNVLQFSDHIKIKHLKSDVGDRWAWLQSSIMYLKNTKRKNYIGVLSSKIRGNSAQFHNRSWKA